jgi:hypothetical protein
VKVKPSPRFKDDLPEQCALLKSKLFLNDESDTSPQRPAPRSPSPTIVKSSEDSLSQSQPEPDTPEPMKRRGSFTTDRLAPPSRQANREPPLVTAEGARELSRSRSRSLSASLALEEQQRNTSAHPLKRSFSREISMSRIFKPKIMLENSQLKEMGESQIASADSPTPKAGLAVTLVEATPQKPRVQSGSFAQFDTGKPPFFRAVEIKEEEEWELPSSPDVLLLRPHSSDTEEESTPRVFVSESPTKDRGARRTMK